MHTLSPVVCLFFSQEFKRHEIMSSETPNVSTSSLSSLRKPNFIQMICVIDKRLNLATLWNLDTFDHKLSLLRDIYNRYIEEGSLPHSSSASSSETAFITDSTDEWQTLDTFKREDETFSPRILENALNRNKQCKRRLSLLGSTASTSCNSSINMPKHTDSLDQCDSAPKTEPVATKRKCLSQIQPTTLGKPFDFTMSLSTLNLNQHQVENEQDTQMQICHSYVFATCRDALNEDDFQCKLFVLSDFSYVLYGTVALRNSAVPLRYGTVRYGCVPVALRYSAVLFRYGTVRYCFVTVQCGTVAFRLHCGTVGSRYSMIRR